MKKLVILFSLILITILGCEKQSMEVLSTPLAPPGYTYFSENPPDNLSHYAYIFQNRNSFSISFWYEGIMTGTNATLFSISNNNYASDLSISKIHIGFRRFIYDMDDSNNNYTCDLIDISSDTLWYGKHHVVITYDGTYQNLYIDGNLQGTKISTYSINSTKISFRSEDGKRWFYYGIISNAYFYTTSLDLDKVKQLYNLDN